MLRRSVIYGTMWPKRAGSWGAWGSFVRWSSKPAMGSSEEKFKRKVQEREKEEMQRKPEWIKRNEAIKKRYGHWNPSKKVSRQQIEDIRMLKEQKPELKTKDLANYFSMSPEAIRRILKSRWVPDEEEEENIERRAEKRKKMSLSEKNRQIEEIQQATARLSLGRAVTAENLEVQRKENTTREKKLAGRFSNEGKINYDSGNSHGYYNKKGLKKRKKRPYTENVADVID